MELAKRRNKMTLILEAVKQSGDGIVSLFIADFILMVFFSTIIFYAEGSGMVLDNRPGSAFTTSNTVAALHRSKTFPSHSGSSLFR
jgi:bifunctional DNase/RNase